MLPGSSDRVEGMLDIEIVEVRIPPATRATSCDAAGLSLAVGEYCVVETDRGLEFGTVVQAGIRAPRPSGADGRLPRVLRRATLEDEEAYAHKVVLEQEGRSFCLTRIAERKLPMKLGHVERQLDGKKMTFFFTADGRVDFRELVRDLTGRFHTRVELRQIGARDDAGMQGGCGTCGRVLCCSDWLKGFDPVSIKMAKAQGLSLNPAKISGICGRLMCCLKFEYDPQAVVRRKPAANRAEEAGVGSHGHGSSPAEPRTPR